MALFLSACNGKITPSITTSDETRMVFVLDHGRHSSLVIEDSQGNLRRYSYGDWQYYALGNTGIFSGIRALAWPTQAALGRRVLAGPASSENVLSQVNVDIVHWQSFPADIDRVIALKTAIESVYQANINSEVYRTDYDLAFVHHPMPYSLLHHSNRMVGEWLVALGCEIHGWPLLSNWQIATKP